MNVAHACGIVLTTRSLSLPKFIHHRPLKSRPLTTESYIKANEVSCGDTQNEEPKGERVVVTSSLDDKAEVQSSRSKAERWVLIPPDLFRFLFSFPP